MARKKRRGRTPKTASPHTSKTSHTSGAHGPKTPLSKNHSRLITYFAVAATIAIAAYKLHTSGIGATIRQTLAGIPKVGHVKIGGTLECTDAPDGQGFSCNLSGNVAVKPLQPKPL